MKQTKQTTEYPEAKKEKKTGIFQLLLLWVIIPLLFASAVFLIIAKFADVNVFDKANEWSKSIPFIGDKEEQDAEAGTLISEEQIVTLQAEIKDKEAQLFKLQQDLETSADKNEKLLIEQEKLLDKIATLQNDKDDSKRKFQEIVTTFEQMSAKSAAPVITKMSDAEAIRILTSLKSETLATILEKMPAEDAAKYTTMMTK